MSVLQLLVVVVGGAGLPAPTAPIELSGGNQVLEVKLDTSNPRGTLRRDGITYWMIKPKLELTSTVETKAGVTAEYRLQFAIDVCSKAKPAEPPARCAYPDGAAPPVILQQHELLLTRKISAAGSDDVTAACVPLNGDGPICRLTGVVSAATASR